MRNLSDRSARLTASVFRSGDTADRGGSSLCAYCWGQPLFGTSAEKIRLKYYSGCLRVRLRCHWHDL